MADTQEMLARTTVTIVCIEVVVPAMIGHQIFRIDRSAEPFESIVIGIGYLQMVYLRTVSYRAESDSVNLLVLLERIPRKLYADVTQDARIICVVRTAVRGARTSFYLHDVFVVPGIATKNQPSPVARFPLSGRHFGSEYNRCIHCSLGYQLSARFYDQGGTGLFVALDDGACLNGQCGAVCDVTPTFHQVSASFQVLMIFYLKGLFSVSDDVFTVNNVVTLSAVLVVRTATAGQANQCCQCDNP